MQRECIVSGPIDGCARVGGSDRRRRRRRSLRRATARVEALAACAVIAHASAGMVACGDRGACSHVYICTQVRIHK
ncbi:hypothetical protein [Oryza sativa Japonica Group]|uniref:Uncharacterized protein n=2 Tax=Oryza sativa subsp. japonica TaxID=39947 RepID=Q5NAJ3_ORYSJ|nr:hypothetical protein [Oryza sativa Japonica Group]BAD82406.1 hypothetical protein [Oryza sativa Japonica Group]